VSHAARLSLIAVEIQALPQHRFGGSVLVPCLEDTRDLIERGGLVGDGRTGDRGQPVHHGRPLEDSLIILPLPFQHTPEIDIGRHELQIEGDGPLQAGASGFKVS